MELLGSAGSSFWAVSAEVEPAAASSFAPFLSAAFFPAASFLSSVSFLFSSLFSEELSFSSEPSSDFCSSPPDSCVCSSAAYVSSGVNDNDAAIPAAARRTNHLFLAILSDSFFFSLCIFFSDGVSIGLLLQPECITCPCSCFLYV
jgi:hypothetical protein